MMTCQMDGVVVRRGHSSIWIETDSWCDHDLFMEALRLLGLMGCTEYETIYDPGTGKETFIFDEQNHVLTDVPLGEAEHLAPGPVRVLRSLVDRGVLL